MGIPDVMDASWHATVLLGLAGTGVPVDEAFVAFVLGKMKWGIEVGPDEYRQAVAALEDARFVAAEPGFPAREVVRVMNTVAVIEFDGNGNTHVVRSRSFATEHEARDGFVSICEDEDDSPLS